MLHTLRYHRSISLYSTLRPAKLVLAAMEAFRQRHALNQLDARLRDDLGLTAQDIAAESRKSLWNVASHRKS